jgi:6-phosphogluconolactonase
MSERKLIVLDGADELFVRAAEEIAHAAGEAICTNGEFRLCLAGGTTPASAYELLATRFRLSVDWRDVEFYWGDERCVAPDDPASNFAMARRAMLDQLEPMPDHVHRMRGEAPPEQAASDYEALMREKFGLCAGEFPRFDLLLLGLGENCHTASLFPGSPFIHERERLCVPVEVADAAHQLRLTLTPPVINNAAHVMFLVAGEKKAHAVSRVLQGTDDPDRMPAQIVAPTDGVVTWLLDRAAASLLQNR